MNIHLIWLPFNFLNLRVGKFVALCFFILCHTGVYINCKFVTLKDL